MSTIIHLRAADDSGGRAPPDVGDAGWPIGKGGRGPTNDIRRLRYSKAEGFRPVASGAFGYY